MLIFIGALGSDPKLSETTTTASFREGNNDILWDLGIKRNGSRNVVLIQFFLIYNLIKTNDKESERGRKRERRRTRNINKYIYVSFRKL